MSRTDRDRLGELRDALDQLDGPDAAQTARMLVQVYDGGSIPGDLPKVFLTHPVTADADDVEGAPPTFGADATVSIPVVVIGTIVPGAGDFLIAHAIGGRWVAGKTGGAASTGCSVPCWDCAGAGIPNKDLEFSWTGVGPVGSGGPIPFTSNCAGGWDTGCFSPTGLDRWVMTCDNTGAGNQIALTYARYDTVCGGSASSGHIDSPTFNIGTINPFSFTYTPANVAPHNAPYNDGYRSITISDPSPTVYCCMVLFLVTVCGGNAMGATVTIWTDSGKGVQLGTATVDINGYADVNIGNNAGSIYYEVSGHGVVTSSATITVTCGQYNVVTPRTVSLTVDSAYVCVGSCHLPVSKTLHTTHPKYGAMTFTYASSGTHGAGWYGTATYSYPGCFCCPARTVTVHGFLSTSFTYQEDWTSS